MQSLTQSFGCGVLQPETPSPQLVGNKAANLMLMADAGLPVPPGFVVTTSVCREYFSSGKKLPANIAAALRASVQLVEQATELRFAGTRRPLLVSVRSGAPVSMPGMMDTVLNIGLCDCTVAPLIRMTGNPRFVWDSYRRLVQAYGEVVAGLPSLPFDRLLQLAVEQHTARSVRELDGFALREITREFLSLYAQLAGSPFPQDPFAQLLAATEAVFKSWQSPRASEYRRLHGIPDDSGTAVTVQAMVFGNMGSTSGSGVAFTRNPTSGENELYLDFLWNAQGEDVVSGRHAVVDGSVLNRTHPALDRQLHEIGKELELLFCDVQDFEFTLQEGKLYLLQTRAAKRTPIAALRIARDLVNENLIDQRTALQRISDLELSAIRIVSLTPNQDATLLSHGIPACPGVAVGPIALDSQAAVRIARSGRTPILVRQDISTDDLPGLAVSAGILTTLGGRTSHAAVVARQMNKVCVVGCKELAFDGKRTCRIAGKILAEQEDLSLDGHTGSVFAGQLKVIEESPTDLLADVATWRSSID